MISVCFFSVVAVFPLCLLLTPWLFVSLRVPPPVSSFADGNKISDAGASALAAALQGSQLTYLDLREYEWNHSQLTD